MEPTFKEYFYILWKECWLSCKHLYSLIIFFSISFFLSLTTNFKLFTTSPFEKFILKRDSNINRLLYFRRTTWSRWSTRSTTTGSRAPSTARPGTSRSATCRSPCPYPTCKPEAYAHHQRIHSFPADVTTNNYLTHSHAILRDIIVKICVESQSRWLSMSSRCNLCWGVTHLLICYDVTLPSIT